MSFKRSRAAFEDRDGPPHRAPYALYGTPLPAFDEQTRDDGSYVPIWKQEVTDERGRKRLHGAFTGGFSAGYFNTVGSKEGWTPSTFVSSRSNRAKADGKDGKQQRAEDFMDEEDLAEQAEAQKLETQGSFAGLGSSNQDGGVRGMFSDLFKATGETKGVKLLQKMGWRQGQGIGPKVKRRAQGDKTGEVHLFAPENSRMITFVRKTDKKGLGFAGEGKLGEDTAVKDDDEESGDDSRILSRSKVARKPKPLKKTGFGTGVLNDDGEDDDDPYSVGPSISYNRIIGQKKKKGGLVTSNTNVVKPTYQPSKKLAQRSTNVNNFRKCHDGRLPLDGFVLATAALTISENKYPPPEVPPGWEPSRQGAGDPANTSYQSTGDAAKASTLDAKARAELLGEQQLPSKSIFDFLTPAQRDKLASASGRKDLPAALSEKAPEGYEPSEDEKRRTLWDLVPSLSKETAIAALARGKTGWMPYSEDPPKRERYKYFLELSTGQQNSLPARVPNTSLEEWAKELREFAEAAEIFKPASGYMASRFTSGSATPKLATDAPDPTARPAPAKDEDPAVKAAKMGMYGPLTRKRESFYPTRLLCKRFNVRPPANVAAGSSAAEDAVEKMDRADRLDLVNKASIERMMRDANFVSGGTEGGHASGDAVPVVPVEKRAVVDVETNEAIEGKKAGEDVFKAIFGSDDEDD
ncbi:Putative G patch domain-containing protein [Septoria linicola]|uniref:G patch domain-containing protein n=1 Tax=Septoria linicola TaxID=215465 RepID=A0A9Q9ACC4_9PEZI|nr:Putative G patch domain-containing protein [Septoria linicola]